MVISDASLPAKYHKPPKKTLKDSRPLSRSRSYTNTTTTQPSNSNSNSKTKSTTELTPLLPNSPHNHRRPLRPLDRSRAHNPNNHQHGLARRRRNPPAVHKLPGRNGLAGTSTVRVRARRGGQRRESECAVCVAQMGCFVLGC